MTKRLKKPEDYSVNPEEFCKVDSPLKAYLFGLLWADGYVKFSETTGGREDTVVLSSTYPDAEEIIPLFKKTGNWCIYTGKVSARAIKTPARIYTNNYFIAKFLSELGYSNKSSNQEKVLSIIPKEYIHYWLLGLIDGDGCLYFNEKRSLYRLSICSCFDQNWSSIEKICTQLSVSYKIERTKSKSGAYSKLNIHGKFNVEKIGDFIYQNKISDLGLKRKFEKFSAIKSKCYAKRAIKSTNSLMDHLCQAN